MKPTHYLWALLLLLLAIAGGASAQSPTLDNKVQSLEEAVRGLERRVAYLEDQLRHRSAAAPIPGVQSDKVNWRKLQKGMSKSDVERLLGSPARVDEFGSFATWSYEAGGDVMFDGRSQTVQRWSEPR